MKKILLLFSIYATLIYAQKSLQFPNEFLFGVASSAYQTEGSWNINGKGENIWDKFSHDNPDRILDGENGDIACDSYNKIKEDVMLLKNLGVDFYRFSLSWTRILPTGYINQINDDGIRYYNELIDELLKNGIMPTITLYHWDLPQSLQEAGGWPNPLIADYFADFSRVAFEHFGDRVKTWITINEPFTFCNGGYGLGIIAPGYKAFGFANYMCSYTCLLAHAKAYYIYDQEFRPTQKGKIGIALHAIWYEPKTPQDVDVAEFAIQVNLGWFMHPIFSKDGDFPPLIKEITYNISMENNLLRSSLPQLTQQEITYIRGTADFCGLNHYSTFLVEHTNETGLSPSISFHASNFSIKLERPSGWEPIQTDWIKIVPWGFRKLLNWIKDQYHNPVVYITENGVGDLDGTLDDELRVKYYKEYLSAVLEAIHEDECNIQGYTAWSYMDTYEWNSGYTLKFGMHYVNFSDPERIRIPKASAKYYRKVIESRYVNHDYEPITNTSHKIDNNFELIIQL